MHSISGLLTFHVLCILLLHAFTRPCISMSLHVSASRLSPIRPHRMLLILLHHFLCDLFRHIVVPYTHLNVDCLPYVLIACSSYYFTIFSVIFFATSSFHTPIFIQFTFLQPVLSDCHMVRWTSSILDSW